MALKRWKFGSYEFTYNPNNDVRQKRASGSEETTLSGAITNTNQFYDNMISITIDLYDKPTHYEKKPIKDTSAFYYSAIAERRLSGELFCLRNGFVDVIRKDGSLVRSVAYAYTGVPVAIAHMDDKIALFFTSGAQGNLYITDENCNQISKYTVTDPDYINCSGLTWDGASSLYVLCKFGKIFKTDYTNGTTTLVKQMDDYQLNKVSQSSAYRGLHYYKGFYGYINRQILTYLNSEFEVVYGNEIPSTTLGYNISIIYGLYTEEFTVLTPTKIIKMYPNVCGVDIELIRNQLKNGIVVLTDEKGRTVNAMITDMGLERKRNRQDARYSVSLSGQIM